MSDVPGDDNRIITPDRFWGFWKLLLLRPFGGSSACACTAPSTFRARARP